MMDAYRSGWAHRYLREAKAELEAAQKIPYMAPSLMLEAIRKARSAIYYSLGEPTFIELLVKEELAKPNPPNDRILHFLIQMEQTVQQLGEIEEINGDAMMKQADFIVQVAEEFVKTLTETELQN
jgi:hypothetical protein